MKKVEPANLETLSSVLSILPCKSDIFCCVTDVFSESLDEFYVGSLEVHVNCILMNA